MLDNKKIMEISQMMQDTNDSIMKNPPKEVRLIEAMKPFFAGAQHKSFDDTIEMLNKIHALKKISARVLPQQPPPHRPQNMPQYAAQSISQDDSIHNDGIYDLDISCIDKKTRTNPQIGTVIMMMALLGKM